MNPDDLSQCLYNEYGSLDTCGGIGAIVKLTWGDRAIRRSSGLLGEGGGDGVVVMVSEGLSQVRSKNY